MVSVTYVELQSAEAGKSSSPGSEGGSVTFVEQCTCNLSHHVAGTVPLFVYIFLHFLSLSFKQKKNEGSWESWILHSEIAVASGLNRVPEEC